VASDVARGSLSAVLVPLYGHAHAAGLRVRLGSPVLNVHLHRHYWRVCRPSRSLRRLNITSAVDTEVSGEFVFSQNGATAHRVQRDRHRHSRRAFLQHWRRSHSGELMTDPTLVLRGSQSGQIVRGTPTKQARFRCHGGTGRRRPERRGRPHVVQRPHGSGGRAASG